MFRESKASEEWENKRIRKEDLRQFVEGHARAGQMFFLERVKRIRELTINQARQDYHSMCEWAQLRKDQRPQGDLEAWRVNHLVLMRKQLDSLKSKDNGT